MKYIKRSKEYFIAPAITLLILCVIFIVKGVYPFGDRLTPYYDMNAQYIPLYTRTYDVLHGNAPVFYNWMNGASENFMANYSCYVFSPTNLLFYFAKRDYIMEFMSFVIMVKFMLASLTMAVYTKKTHDPHPLVTIAVSILYTFSGYDLQYYTNIFFIDIVIILPLLMLSLDRLLKNGKVIAYTAIAALTISINYYISSMIFIYIILYSLGVLIFEFKDKEQRCRTCARLGISTFIAVLISAAFSIPSALKLSSSNRVDYNDSTYSKLILVRHGDFDPQKLFMLFGAEAGIAALIITVIMFRKSKKPIEGRTKLHIYLIALLIMPIIFESTNLIWHLGSYMHFPYRFAFVLTFTAGDILARYFVLASDKEQPIKPRVALFDRFKESLVLLISFISVTAIGVMAFQMKNIGIADLDIYTLYKFALIPGVIAAVIAFGICGKKFRTVFILSIAVIQSAAAGYGLLAPSESKFTNEFPIYLKNNYDLPKDNVSRVKQASMTVFANYGMVLGTPTLADWSNDASYDYSKTMRDLGYSKSYIYQFDNGGTAFTDALLNVKKAFSMPSVEDHVSKELYTAPEKTPSAVMYDCKYTLPFGLLTNEDFIEASNSEPANTFDYQNKLYKALTGDNDDLFTVYRYSDILDDAKCEMKTNILFTYPHTGTITIPNESCLYIWKDKRSEDDRSSNDENKLLESSMDININGEPYYIPCYGKVELNRYPQKNTNGSVLLGTYKNETIRISAVSTDADVSDVYFGVMDLKKLEKLCDSLENVSAYDVSAHDYDLDMKVDSPNGRYVFIPIEYDKDWKAEINGSSAELTPVMNGAFMALELGNDDADIHLHYTPVMFYKCGVISFAGLILFALLIFALKKGHDPANVKAVSRTAGVLFAVIGIGVLVVLIVIPAAAYPVSFFIK